MGSIILLVEAWLIIVCLLLANICWVWAGYMMLEVWGHIIRDEKWMAIGAIHRPSGNSLNSLVAVPISHLMQVQWAYISHLKASQDHYPWTIQAASTWSPCGPSSCSWSSLVSSMFLRSVCPSPLLFPWLSLQVIPESTSPINCMNTNLTLLVLLLENLTYDSWYLRQ